ncbi:ABC transporter ATP-binding protein [Rossellomorea sp. BNER]|uniref:ABC transporter ATP-binding protein n=1 Tax=Rossellomorea sp. BNER TaxID=2962031 RepID=UPI003AF31253|nr:ABC transporter ATP-binding protein [Rossellomorea sp. BNER]
MNEVLKVEDLEVGVPTEQGFANIVNGVSFSLEKGKTLGIVGESGCGKSMTSLSLMGLLPPAVSYRGGTINLKDNELTSIPKKAWRKLRGKDIAMIFQEPMTSLNPVYTIGSQIVELILNHRKISKKDAYAHALKMLQLVGIPRAEEVLHEYPHQLSGGMRQRVMIAMALSCNPEVLVADEPTTALDVTIQAQILELMKSLQEELKMSILLITHDLGVVAEMCDKVVVMYAGEIVEESTVIELFESPKHPYTKGLIASLPDIEDEKEYLSSIPGTVPSPTDMPPGCRFAPRCTFAHEQCRQAPPVVSVNQESRTKCWLYVKEEIPVKEGM